MPGGKDRETSGQVFLRGVARKRFLTCRVRVPEQCSALCSPRRSSAVFMGRTLGVVEKADGVFHVPSIPSSLCPHPKPANLYLPEHHLDRRLWRLWPMLQAARGVPVAAMGITILEPSGS